MTPATIRRDADDDWARTPCSALLRPGPPLRRRRAASSPVLRRAGGPVPLRNPGGGHELPALALPEAGQPFAADPQREESNRPTGSGPPGAPLRPAQQDPGRIQRTDNGPALWLSA